MVLLRNFTDASVDVLTRGLKVWSSQPALHAIQGLQPANPYLTHKLLEALIETGAHGGDSWRRLTITNLQYSSLEVRELLAHESISCCRSDDDGSPSIAFTPAGLRDLVRHVPLVDPKPALEVRIAPLESLTIYELLSMMRPDWVWRPFPRKVSDRQAYH